MTATYTPEQTETSKLLTVVNELKQLYDFKRNRVNELEASLGRAVVKDPDGDHSSLIELIRCESAARDAYDTSWKAVNRLRA